ncbi:hypothetical protein ACFO26_09735 [Lactococcus nasutitermitis]|uniref:Uncharacterized protein n=1 Tax=Lactococcus nasutitermitis TaxID=1652957 RepID=A0ABV9JGV8_9LACT|nr:hypothetical protein [Lactococcus nasutitermitis]
MFGKSVTTKSPKITSLGSKKAYDQKLLGWFYEFGEEGRGLLGIYYNTFLKGKTFPKAEVFGETTPDLFIIAGSPAKGYPGDYLIHNDTMVNKYRIISASAFKKECKVISD